MLILATSSATSVMITAAGVLAVVMLVTWVASVAVRDASIVDIVWGLGFVAVAWTAFSVGDGVDGRRWLVTVLTTIWGARLAAHLAWRNLGHGEDRRYQSMRRRQGRHFWLWSLVTVFLLQGVLLWVVSLPVQLAQVPDEPGLGFLALIGAAVWAVGFAFETVGDVQLARFKARPDSEGQVMDRGLWRYTRHPNYFGDCLVWWGLFLVAVEADGAWFSVIGPVVMTVLLVKVSGVPMLERSLNRRRPAYADYVARTSAFIPRPPKRP